LQLEEAEEGMMPRRRCLLVPLVASVLALVSWVLTIGTAHALVVRLTLAPPASGGGAQGTAMLKVQGHGARRTGMLIVRVARLAPRATFDLTLDGVRIGSLATSRRGAASARLRTRPRRGDQLLGTDPRGRDLRVVAAGGVAVLGGRVSTRGLDPGKIRCCLADDSGPECEDRTPAACATEGGVDLGTGSCLPDPCAGSTAAGGDVRCCVPDDSGPKCEDRTPSECAAQRGVNIGGGGCTPNPCGGSTTSTTLPGGGVPAVRVRCERGANRSKISVDGTNLAAGTYGAQVVSGTSTAAAELQAAVGDEAEFDFDSDPGDVAAGATPIPATFIQGTPPQVTGRVISTSGDTVAEETVTCLER
jgi:hypothetical protein